MKNIKSFLAVCAIFTLVLAGCSKDEPGTNDGPASSETAILQLGPILNSPETRAAIRQQEGQDIPDCSDEAPGFAQLSIIYGPDDTVKENIIIPILEDDQGLFTAYSEELELPIPAGETTVSVTLTQFVVWTNDGGSPGEVIWVAPIEGSEYADFVDQPVGENFTFDLRAGSKNYINVDVICYDDRDVNLYGYQFFTITPIPLIKFCIFGNYCTPEGRHFVASYSVNVWESNDGQKGDPIYTGLQNVVEGEGGDAYSDPLCFFLPDRLDVDDNEEEYYVEITLLSDTPGYNGPDIVFAEGPITVTEIKLFFGEDGTLDYYHFQYGCDDGVPPPFGQPETKRYKACIKYLDDSDEVAGFAYLSLEGSVLQAVTSVFGLKVGEMHPQHIHENASCGDYGPVAVSLDYNEGGFPVAQLFNNVSFLNYAETIPGFFLQDLEDRTVVIHGKDVNGEYVPTEPVACGEFEEY